MSNPGVRLALCLGAATLLLAALVVVARLAGPSTRPQHLAYLQSLTSVCNAIDAYGAALDGSPNDILTTAVKVNDAMTSAGGAFHDWAALTPPADWPPDLLTLANGYRTSPFDLISEPLRLQNDCRQLQTRIINEDLSGASGPPVVQDDGAGSRMLAPVG